MTVYNVLEGLGLLADQKCPVRIRLVHGTKSAYIHNGPCGLVMDAILGLTVRGIGIVKQGGKTKKVTVCATV